MERNNVLLKITDLRQYFPVGKKKGLYVKANDGISLNIYEGETVEEYKSINVSLYFFVPNA